MLDNFFGPFHVVDRSICNDKKGRVPGGDCHRPRDEVARISSTWATLVGAAIGAGRRLRRRRRSFSIVLLWPRSLRRRRWRPLTSVSYVGAFCAEFVRRGFRFSVDRVSMNRRVARIGMSWRVFAGRHKIFDSFFGLPDSLREQRTSNAHKLRLFLRYSSG